MGGDDAAAVEEEGSFVDNNNNKKSKKKIAGWRAEQDEDEGEQGEDMKKDTLVGVVHRGDCRSFFCQGEEKKEEEAKNASEVRSLYADIHLMMKKKTMRRRKKKKRPPRSLSFH